jgi:hypothetical protein
MQKFTSLIVLFESLSKAEKRYVCLASQLQSGDKKYMYLFDLMEKNLPEEAVHAQFCAKYGEASFRPSVKHLYEAMMGCLIHLHKRQDISAKIFVLLTEADILYGRALFEEALDALSRAKKLASTYEKDALMLLIRRTELQYLNATDFRNINEKQLIGKQMKITEGMKYSRSAILHSSLYDILKHRLTYKGYARSEKQNQGLNDLVLSELHLIANESYKGFETQKLHLLFQATYYLHSGSYKMAIRFYQTLIDLFESNRQMILSPPIYYLQAILGILDSLKAAALWSEMPFFIGKLKEIEQGDYAAEFTLHVRAHIFLYEFASAFNSVSFEAAAALMQASDASLFQNLSLLRLDVQLDLFLCFTILDLATGNLKSAHRNMKKIISSGKLFYVFPAYRHARLINLLLQAEQENYEFIDNEITSLKRSVRSEHQLYSTEKLLFRFLLLHHQLGSPKMRDKLLKQLRKQSVKIACNKYEQQLLTVFDFLAWMESRLTQKTFGEALAERMKSPQKNR